MGMVKKLSEQRRTRIKHQIEKALLALTEEMDEPEVALRSLDKAMKLFNGRDRYNEGELRYDELNDACDAFLEEVELPTLAVAINYIGHWRREEKFAKLGHAVYDAECDMTHYWRCASWQAEEGKRHSSHPIPSDEKCDCGLKEITAASTKIYRDEPKEEAE